VGWCVSIVDNETTIWNKEFLKRRFICSAALFGGSTLTAATLALILHRSGYLKEQALLFSLVSVGALAIGLLISLHREQYHLTSLVPSFMATWLTRFRIKRIYLGASENLERLLDIERLANFKLALDLGRSGLEIPVKPRIVEKEKRRHDLRRATENFISLLGEKRVLEGIQSLVWSETKAKQNIEWRVEPRDTYWAIPEKERILWKTIGRQFEGLSPSLEVAFVIWRCLQFSKYVGTKRWEIGLAIKFSNPEINFINIHFQFTENAQIEISLVYLTPREPLDADKKLMHLSFCPFLDPSWKIKAFCEVIEWLSWHLGGTKMGHSDIPTTNRE